jgi:hypothetical protein
MERFIVTLVVWLSFANPDFGDGYREARTPGLTEEACKAAAKLVHYPQGTAHCVVEGRPEPQWSPPTPETFTLDVTRRIGIGLQRTWTPNLSESECKARAELVDPAQGWARCSSSRRPSPARECAACGEIPGRKPA